MNSSSTLRIPGQDRKIAEFLASGIGCLIVLFKAPTLLQNALAALGRKKYITLAELSQLYFSLPKERLTELRSVLNQIAGDFNGWLRFFITNRSNKEIRPMIVSELIAAAQTFGEKETIIKYLDENEKKQILEAMKKETGTWSEIMAILSQDFDAKLYKRALSLAKNDKEKLLALTRLNNISNHRRAYLYRCLLEMKDSLSSEELLSLYRRSSRKSIMRSRILAILGQRENIFSFWLRIYQTEFHNTKLKNLSLEKITAADIEPEILVKTCNDYGDKKFIGLAAAKLEKTELPSLRWERLYDETTLNAPEIREIILNKLRLAIPPDNSQESRKISSILYIKSIHYYPAIAENIMIDLINRLPELHNPTGLCLAAVELPAQPPSPLRVWPLENKRQDPLGLQAANQERLALLNTIKSLIIKSDAPSLKRLLALLAPKIKDHEEWIDLSKQSKPYPHLQRLIIEEYRKFFIQDFRQVCLSSPSAKTAPADLRNREIRKIWETKLKEVKLVA